MNKQADLRKWFKEKWVDISRKNPDGSHPECGRDEAKLGKKGYPKCRPKAKAAQMTKKEKSYAVRAKRSKRQGVGGKPTMVPTEKPEKQTKTAAMEKIAKNVPTDPAKWSQAKAQAKAKFDVYPSAYANGWAAKKYKEMGGGWKKEASLMDKVARVIDVTANNPTLSSSRALVPTGGGGGTRAMVPSSGPRPMPSAAGGASRFARAANAFKGMSTGKKIGVGAGVLGAGLLAKKMLSRKPKPQQQTVVVKTADDHLTTMDNHIPSHNSLAEFIEKTAVSKKEFRAMMVDRMKQQDEQDQQSRVEKATAKEKKSRYGSKHKTQVMRTSEREEARERFDNTFYGDLTRADGTPIFSGSAEHHHAILQATPKKQRAAVAKALDMPDAKPTLKQRLGQGARMGAAGAVLGAVPGAYVGALASRPGRGLKDIGKATAAGAGIGALTLGAMGLKEGGRYKRRYENVSRAAGFDKQASLITGAFLTKIAAQLDPVGQEDADIDNDGDHDKSDKYLMKRRKAIGKAMSKRKGGEAMDKEAAMEADFKATDAGKGAAMSAIRGKSEEQKKRERRGLALALGIPAAMVGGSFAYDALKKKAAACGSTDQPEHKRVPGKKKKAPLQKEASRTLAVDALAAHYRQQQKPSLIGRGAGIGLGVAGGLTAAHLMKKRRERKAAAAAEARKEAN